MSEPLQVPDYGQQSQQQMAPSEQGDIGGAASTTGSGSVGGLNETLNTDHLDIPASDVSFAAMITRYIAGFVGKCFTPHQIIVFLRILKAVTFCFLVLNIFAVSMYILFVDIMASNVVKKELGGWRDLVLRLYALVLSVMAICLELDVMNVVRHYVGLKGFIPRALLLYFISIITTTIRIPDSFDDDAVVNDDDISIRIAAEIPDSAVVFQKVTSWTL